MGITKGLVSSPGRLTGACKTGPFLAEEENVEPPEPKMGEEPKNARWNNLPGMKAPWKRTTVLILSREPPGGMVLHSHPPIQSVAVSLVEEQWL